MTRGARMTPDPLTGGSGVPARSLLEGVGSGDSCGNPGGCPLEVAVSGWPELAGLHGRVPCEHVRVTWPVLIFHDGKRVAVVRVDRFDGPDGEAWLDRVRGWAVR